jgi:hypothetical protein
VKRFALIPLCLACADPTGPVSAPTYQFGRVTASIDGRAWHSSYFPDSLVAFYDTTTGRLEIIGQEVRSGSWPTLLLVLPSEAVPGAYHLTSDALGRLGTWTPGLHESYVSAGAPNDSLWVEELDLVARTVRGAFQFVGAPFFTQTSVYIVGRFAGTVRLLP